MGLRSLGASIIIYCKETIPFNNKAATWTVHRLTHQKLYGKDHLADDALEMVWYVHIYIYIYTYVYTYMAQASA